MTKKNASTILQLVIFLGLGISLIVWRYNDMSAEEREEMSNAFSNVRWIYAIPIFIIGFLSHYFRALRWKLLLEPLGIKPSTANTTFSVLIGYLVNALVPRLGEVAKCTVLAKYEKVPADKLVGTIIAERAFDLVSLIVIAFLTLFLQYNIIAPYAHKLYRDLLTDSSGNFIWLRIVILLAVAAAGILAVVLLYRKIKNSKIGHIIKGIGDGLKSIGIVKHKLLFLVYTVLIWTMYTSAVVVGFYALPATEHLSPLAGLAVITFGSLGMIATPGGIGVYPEIVAKVLTFYGLLNVYGLAYGWVSWGAQTAIVLILGLAALALLPVYNRTSNENIQEGIRTS